MIIDLVWPQRVNVQRDAMVRERKDRTVNRVLICRSRLHWRQDPQAAPAVIGLLKQDRLLPGNERVMLRHPQCRRPRFSYWKGLRIFCATAFFDWTNPALWLAGRTNQRAEIDQGRIVNPGARFWDQRASALPKLFPASGSIDRAVKIKQTRQNAGSVGFDNRNWLIKGERRDGMRSVTPDAGQFTGYREVARKSARMVML